RALDKRRRERGDGTVRVGAPHGPARDHVAGGSDRGAETGAVEASRGVPVAVHLDDELGTRAPPAPRDLGCDALVRALGDDYVGAEVLQLARDLERQRRVEARSVDMAWRDQVEARVAPGAAREHA